jgi:hypothetical protein
MLHRRRDDAVVIGQPRHHVGPPRQLEQVDLAVQPRVQPRQRLFRPPAKEPAHRGEQEMRGKADRGKADDQHQKPKRNLDRPEHGAHPARKPGNVKTAPR